MQSVDPKDRPKLYALIGGAVVVFGVVIFVTMKSIADVTPPHHAPVATTATPAANTTVATTTPAPGGAAPTGSPAPTAATPPTGGAAPAGGAATSPAVSIPGSFVVDVERPQGRDPFKIVPDDKLAQAAVLVRTLFPPPPVPTNVPTPPVLPGIAGIGGNLVKTLPKMADHGKELKGIFDEIQNAGRPNPRVIVEKAPPPPYAVIGVLIGEPGGRDVAILHRTSGVDEKRYVVAGDVLDGGYKVDAIEAEGVRLRTIGHDGSDGLDTTFLKRQSDISGPPVTIPLGGTGSTPAK